MKLTTLRWRPVDIPFVRVVRLADRAYAAYFERPPQLKGSRYAAVGRLKGRLKSLESN